MLAPGLAEQPNHRITTEVISEKVEVFVDGEKVAESVNALRLFEPGYEPRIYIPREDIRGIEFIKTGDYQCPFKGQAELYDVKHGFNRFHDAAWSYTSTFDDMKEIRNLVAFYPNKVQLIRISGQKKH